MRRIKAGSCPQEGEGPGRVKRLTLAILASLPLSSWGFGVGDVELQSRYAQPLAARVPITLTTPSEVIQPSDLSVRLLPQSAYEGMGLSAPPVPTEALSLNVSGSGQAFWVELSSRQPIVEPMMTLLLEVRVAGVRIVRELPFLFDLPPAVPVSRQPALASSVAPAAAESSPAESQVPQAVVTQVPAVPQSASVAAPTDLLPAVAAAPVAAPTVKPRVIIRRAARPKTEERKKTTFQLATWNQTGVAPKVLLPRFQLAQSFDSYAQLAQAGAAPLPATSAAELAVTTPVAMETASPLPVATAVIESTPAANEGGGWFWWALLTSAVAAVAVYWRRRRTIADTLIASTGQAMAVPRPPAVNNVTESNAVEPAAAPAAKIEQSLPVLEIVQEPVAPPAVAEPLSATVSGPGAATATDTRKRLADLTARVAGDANLLRKLQLVGAYIDLNRLESAETLLSEIEAETSGSVRPKFTLIKG